MPKIKQKFDLILASTSPVRKEILQNLGFDFKVVSPNFDEDEAKKFISHLNISDQALFLAKGKAKSVSENYQDSLVIGSDQICQIGDQTISKPKNKDEAIAQLKRMSGQTHYQNNAVCLFKNGEEIFVDLQKAALKMRELNEDEIISYVNLDNPVGCAGSYKIESLGRHLFEEINGDIACISGLAVQPLLKFLYQNLLIKL